MTANPVDEEEDADEPAGDPDTDAVLAAGPAPADGSATPEAAPDSGSPEPVTAEPVTAQAGGTADAGDPPFPAVTTNGAESVAVPGSGGQEARP